MIFSDFILTFVNMKKPSFQLIKVRYLAEISGINRGRLFQNVNGEVNSLTDDERTRLANILWKEINRIMSWIGYRLDKPVKVKDLSPPPRPKMMNHQ